MAKLNKWDSRHMKDLERYARQIAAIYQSAVREAAAIGVSVADFNPDKPFSFADYPSTQARINKLLNSLKTDIQTVVLNGVDAEWTLANNKNNELANRVFGQYAKNLTPAQSRRYFSNNDDARRAFIERKTAGLKLSDKVWKYTDQFKAEIEMGIDLGLRSGMSADELSRDLRQYLQQPQKLFRRVRDEHGALQLSKQAAAYHPGAGVYRSSYKNARRLAATETNLAYRTADHTRWQQLDFVVGIEVRLSNNHTLNGVPFTDICDDLAGRYPKNFKFTGWHPLCRCHAVSILKTPEEMEADNERIMNGEAIDGDSVNRVSDMPKQFKAWIKENDDRIARANERGTLPYFLKDNRGLWADLSTVEIINRQSIAETVGHAGAFGASSKVLAMALGVQITPVNIKSERRVIEKASGSYNGDVAKVNDIIRNTFIAQPSEIDSVLEAVRERFKVIDYKAQRTDMGYTGHLFKVWYSDGVKAEIQVNSPQMIYAKEPTARKILGTRLYDQIRRKSGLTNGLGHTYYEEYRTLEKLTSRTLEQTERMRELEGLSREYYKKIGSVKL